MRTFVMSALTLAAGLLTSEALAQPACLRPQWTECVSFPNGGRHTGVDAYGARLEMAITPGPDICVSNEWEIRAETYAQFSRDGRPWPNPDWEVLVDNFCFYRN